MGVLFLTQSLGLHLTPAQIGIVLLMAAAASIIAPGVPEAGLATMPLIFHALGLYSVVHFIAVFLSLDWFLDRCRTTVNVMGHVTVACLLDGRTSRAVASASPQEKIESSAW